MARQNFQHGKRQRELAKKQKREEKLERKLHKKNHPEGEEAPPVEGAPETGTSEELDSSEQAEP